MSPAKAVPAVYSGAYMPWEPTLLVDVYFEPVFPFFMPVLCTWWLSLYIQRSKNDDIVY